MNDIEMTSPPFPPILRGDFLLYNTLCFMGAVIREKTGEPVTHVEVYAGEGISLASRDGLGVDAYDFRASDLAAVLRPVDPLEWDTAYEWFKTVRGSGYDWRGLLSFANLVSSGEPHHLFCSAFATEFCRRGQTEPFHQDYPSVKVAPGYLLMSGKFKWVYKAFNF